MGLGLRRLMERASGASPPVRRLLTKIYLLKDGLRHGEAPPIDRALGWSTQDPLPLFLSQTGSASDATMIPYAACVPSAVRRALASLPNVTDASFIDIGCGKGRALGIAADRPFARLIGVEINPDLAQAAARNMRRLPGHRPSGPASIIESDASAPQLPDGPIVAFMYHPFGEALVQRLCATLAAHPHPVSVIYENPVHGAVFDRSPAFARHFAEMVPCEPKERPFTFDPEEAVIVWRKNEPENGDARAAIRTVKPGYRVVLDEVGSASAITEPS